MGHERVAVVGIGQTKHEATRGDVSVAGLLREAAGRALADAEMTWSDIDAVVIGKAWTSPSLAATRSMNADTAEGRCRRLA